MDQVCIPDSLVLMTVQAWLKTYSIRSDDNPLYQIFVEMYMDFYRKGVAPSSLAESDMHELIPSVGMLLRPLAFTRPYTFYGGQTEIYLLVCPDNGEPMAFVTAQHFMPCYAHLPEIVYLAHLGKNNRTSRLKGPFGRMLLDKLRTEAWRRLPIMLEVESGLVDANSLMRWYLKNDFVMCDDLAPRENEWYWHNFLLEAAARGYFNNIRTKYSGKSKDFLTLKDEVCVRSLSRKASYWFLYIPYRDDDDNAERADARKDIDYAAYKAM